LSQSVIANRYAIALFELAQKTGQITEVHENLHVVKEVYQDNIELKQLLENPKLSMVEKKDLLTSLFKGANPLILNTLFVLLEKDRMNELVSLVNEFHELANDVSGIADAEVYSTRPLTEQEKTAISTTFANKIGKQSLRIENIIDERLLGGIRLQIGNRIYDSSLSAKLERLKKELIGS